jgi:hypothetical protein
LFKPAQVIREFDKIRADVEPPTVIVVVVDGARIDTVDVRPLVANRKYNVAILGDPLSTSRFELCDRPLFTFVHRFRHRDKVVKVDTVFFELLDR